MSDTIIRVTNLTKDYGNQRGVFDLNLEVKRGEVYGFVGTNGSGKTTTIRHMMGFLQADKGSVEILEQDAWKNATELKKYVSYVPGEIFFPNVGSGINFLKLQAEYLGIKDLTYTNELIKLLQLDPSAGLKRMSKGMKQKTAIVAALMGDKDILILDEPTTGLDPLMRDAFLDLIRQEKEKGKTIFMSSHIFEEIEEVCDKVSMIKDGKIIGTLDLNEYREDNSRKYLIEFATVSDMDSFEKVSQWQMKKEGETSAVIVFEKTQVKEFLKVLSAYNIKALKEQRQTLGDMFKQMFKEGNSDE